MLVFVERRHIEAAAAARDKSLPWGSQCPIARAMCEQLNLPLGSVYAGPMSTWVNWNGQEPIIMGPDYDTQTKFYTTDSASAFMAQVDNVCDPENAEPCVVELRQFPDHLGRGTDLSTFEPTVSLQDSPNGSGDGKPEYP